MMPSHRSPERRNRNIGTKMSGYKKQSRFRIAYQNQKPFYANIKIQGHCQKTVNGKIYNFIVEKLKPNYTYTCNIDEICEVLSHCPDNEIEGLNLIILRQPKQKEEILNPCWGRFIYNFDYNGVLQPAIILEAINLNKEIKIKKSELSPSFQKELQFLQLEGNEITFDKRQITIKMTFQSAKNTQLYRTLLHEIGHYVYYKNGYVANDYEVKETYANNYAKRIRKTF
ncbi:MAG: hypothetical protein Q8876_01270 [Bacillota bacterium]|nr:hypothetical protein [Bacillota bacterium]